MPLAWCDDTYGVMCKAVWNVYESPGESVYHKPQLTRSRLVIWWVGSTFTKRLDIVIR
jgi:hypothetical protein